MGIPGFNVWFSKKYEKAYVPLNKIRVDHLYIDMNSVLHTVMRNARNYNHFHKLLHTRLNSIMLHTLPTKSVMLAVDGPAPLAKLLTQRERRKKTSRTVKEGEALTGIAITPGTTFMLDLTHSLTFWCCTKMSDKRFRNVAFELSDGTVKGEGEVKILGRLARPWYPEEANDTHVIVGDDADLILMALTSYKDNLFVANSSLNKGRLDRNTKLFSVNLLHQAWASGFLAKVVAAGKVPLESALLHAKMDLTLLAILAKGNDYLPGLRGASLEGGYAGGLWASYQMSARTLSAAGAVTSIDPASGTPRLDTSAMARLMQLAGATGSGSGGSDDEWRGSKASADPRAYLQGCVWVLQMYLTGQCPDYRFVYDGMAPNTAAVRAVCDSLVAADQPYITLETFGPMDPLAAKPLLPVACALALLPANCRHLAAPCVQQLMDMPSSTADGDTAVVAGPGASRQQAPPRFDPEVYFDLYEDCAACRASSAELGILHREYMVAKEAQAEQKAQELRAKLQFAEAQRKSHISQAHPYRRFPIEKLEAVADAVLSIGPIKPVERFATVFGRPQVLRAFNSMPEAAAFIRSQAAATSRPPQLPSPTSSSSFFHHSQHLPGGQHKQQQQLRGAATWQQQPPTPLDYVAMFVAPPPPFKVENASYFPAIVRQEVLDDEYGSMAPVHLRLAPRAPNEVVQYLSQLQSSSGVEGGGAAAAVSVYAPPSARSGKRIGGKQGAMTGITVVASGSEAGSDRSAGGKPVLKSRGRPNSSTKKSTAAARHPTATVSATGSGAATNAAVAASAAASMPSTTCAAAATAAVFSTPPPMPSSRLMMAFGRPSPPSPADASCCGYGYVIHTPPPSLSQPAAPPAPAPVQQVHPTQAQYQSAMKRAPEHSTVYLNAPRRFLASATYPLHLPTGYAGNGFGRIGGSLSFPLLRSSAQPYRPLSPVQTAARAGAAGGAGFSRASRGPRRI